MIQKAIQKLRSAVSNIITRAVITNIVQEDGKIFVQVTGLNGSTRDRVELLQQYGFRSFPRVGARGSMLAKGGKINNSSVICADDKRYGTEAFVPGESRQFDDSGAFHSILEGMHMSEGEDYSWKVDDNNNIEFTDDSFKITVGGTVYEFTPTDLILNGKPYLTHTHPITSGSSAPGPTGPVSP